jgi:hypothetical protein
VSEEQGEKCGFNPGHAVANILFQLEDDPRCGFKELPFFVSHLMILRGPPWPFLDGSMNSGVTDYLVHREFRDFFIRSDNKRTVLPAALMLALYYLPIDGATRKAS